MVQCKRTGSRSQFRAGVGPLLPLESERCPAFAAWAHGTCQRTALCAAHPLSTALCSACALRERQTQTHGEAQEEQRRCWQARRYCQDDRAGQEAGEVAEEIKNNIISAGA